MLLVCNLTGVSDINSLSAAWDVSPAVSVFTPNFLTYHSMQGYEIGRVR